MSAVSALNELDDMRITHIKPLIPPQILMEDLPLSLKAAETILNGRQGAEDIIHGRDDRLLVIVGPCSIHDVESGLEYGKLGLTEG
jgi:3-deoxy-7-phosphoheptulonate synthase